MINAKTFRADILLLLTAALWGFGFVAQSSGMDYVGPFTYNALRFPLGSLSLAPLILLARRRKKPPAGAVSPPGAGHGEALRSTLLAGAMLFCAVALQQIGIIFTTVGNAGFITGFYVVLTPVFGLALGKMTGKSTWIGMIFALAGLYLIFAAGSAVSINPGDIFILVSSCFWAAHILIIDRLVQKTDPLVLSAGQFAFCGLFCLAAALAAEPFIAAWALHIAPDFPPPHWKTLAELAEGGLMGLSGAVIPILYGGLVSVGIAYTLQVFAQRDAPPAHAAIILCLEGTFAALGGILLRGEKPGPFTLAGFVCMLCGMLITQWDLIRPGKLPKKL